MADTEDDWAGCGCEDCQERYAKKPSKKQRWKARIAELEAEVEAQKAKQVALVEQRTAAEGKQADVYDALADAGFVWTGSAGTDRIRQLRHGLVPLGLAQPSQLQVIHEPWRFSGVSLRASFALEPNEAQAVRDWQANR